MPSQDEQALDWVAQNRQDPRAPQVMQKLGIEPIDVEGWSWAKTNANDERAPQVRNKIFEKVANTVPTENVQGVGFVDRLAIKNLIPNEPELQKRYLEKKGFQTRIVDGEVEVRKPDEPSFKRIDPKGIDLWDVTDIAGDIAEAFVTGSAAVTGALAGLGTTAGLGSIPAGAAAAGVAGAGFEAARQGLGVATGLREPSEIRGEEIATTGLISAIAPSVVRAGGKAIRAAGEAGEFVLQKLKMIPNYKPTAEAIKEAAETIGAKATPGQLFDNKLVQKLEDIQFRRSGTLGGAGLRRTIEANQQAARQTAESLLEGATAKTKTEVGQDVGEILTEDLAQKLKPAEALYDDVAAVLPDVKVKISDSILDRLQELQTRSRYDKAAKSFVQDKIDEIMKLKTLDDLKEFRTSVRNEVKGLYNNVGNAGREISSILTEARSDSFLDAAKNMGDDLFEVTKQKLEIADKIYREAAEDVANVVNSRGKPLKAGVKAGLKEFLEKTPEIERITKILKTNDPKKIAKVQEAFPRAFEQLRQSKLAEIADFATEKGAISPTKVVKKFRAMPPETAALIFGDNGVQKAKALGVYLDSLPPVVNPSGTSEGLQLRNLLSMFEQAKSLGTSAVSAFIRSPTMTSEFAKKMGDALYGSIPISAASQFIGKQGLVEEPERMRARGLGGAIPRDRSPLLRSQ